MKRLIAALIVAGMCLSLTLPVQASTPGSMRVVALGDSYGSGVGANDYRVGTEGACWRSSNSPSEAVVRRLRADGLTVAFTNVTCSGAVIDDLYRSYRGAVQLDALRPDTDLVILTIGGNDIGFAPLVAQCLQGNCAGTPTNLAIARLPWMAQKQSKLLHEIKVRSPRAKIVQLGYGRPMTPGPNGPGTPGVELDPICAPQYFSPEERQDGARLSADLDLTLRLVVGSARLSGVPVTFVSPYDKNWWNRQLGPRFTGHSLCEAVLPGQFYRGFDALAPLPYGDAAGQTAILHMNKVGYEQLAQLALAEALGRS